MKEAFLARPVLPQTSGEQLNVGAIQGDAIVVKIPPYEEVDQGDKVIVCFSGEEGQGSVTRYSYVAGGTNFPMSGLEVLVSPLSVLHNGKFTVTYQIESRTANFASSRTTTIDVVNAVPQESNMQCHQASYLGSYKAGVVDTWIVPFDYTIASTLDVKSAAWPGTLNQGAARLTLCHRPADSAEQADVGVLTFSAGSWVFSLSGGPVKIDAGDELSFRLAANADLSVSVTV